MKYSMDSAICLSAFHAGALGEFGGEIIVELDEGLTKFESSMRNGVTSTNREGNVNDPSLKFEKVKDAEQIIKDDMEEGKSVDFLNKKTG